MQWTLYKHFKGKPYIELGEGLDSETEEPLTFYRCLYDSTRSQSWVRSRGQFHAEVSPGVPRFKPVALLRSSPARENTKGAHFNLAAMEGTLIASAHIAPAVEPAWEITNLETAPEHRRKGHAALLLRAIREILAFFACPRQSAPVLLAQTSEHRVFFERCGFQKLPAELQPVPDAHLMATQFPPPFGGPLKEFLLTKKIHRSTGME